MFRPRSRCDHFGCVLRPHPDYCLADRMRSRDIQSRPHPHRTNKVVLASRLDILLCYTPVASKHHLSALPTPISRMPNKIRQDNTTIEETSFSYVFEQNATIKLKDASGLVRCYVYRPKDGAGRWPVLITYGPYGKDIPYQE